MTFSRDGSVRFVKWFLSCCVCLFSQVYGGEEVALSQMSGQMARRELPRSVFKSAL